MKCYKCQNQLPAGARNCPSCGQAVYTTYSAGAPSMGRRLDGCMRDVPSTKDHLATPLLSTLPRQVDLREHCGAVEDQGQIGSCTANAAVGAMEYQMKKAGKPTVELSRMFVYFNARRMRAAVDVDTGATIAECMASFLAYGAPPEQAWPYDPNLISKTPDQAAYNAALDYVPAEYARVKGFENIKGSLAQQYPVVFGISLPSACYDEAGKTGMMPKVTAAEVEAGRAGGHAMLIVGYDTDAGVFLVRNSWGHGWGERGYFRMPFDTFNAATSSVDSWILGKLDASHEFHIIRPEVTVKPVEGGVKDMAAKMREEIRGSLTKDIKDSFKEIKDRVHRRNPQ